MPSMAGTYLRRAVILAGIVAAGVTCSCSGPARAKKLLKASERLCGEARASLLAGNAGRAQTRSDQARRAAERAARVLSSGPLKEMASEQLAEAKILSSVFTDPVASIQLWLRALGAKDFDLAFVAFDQDVFVDAFFSHREPPTEAERARFRQAFEGSFQLTFKKYGEFLSAWNLAETKAEILGDSASVESQLELMGKKERVRFWLVKKAGMWKVQDFSTSKDGVARASELFERAGMRIAADADPAEVFEGKGFFEALSEAGAADQSELARWDSPLVGHYVRALKAVDMKRGDRDVSVPQGMLLLVVQQQPADKSVLYVRTTEANVRDAAIGTVRLEETQVVGTDETELWGTDSTVDGG